MVGLVQRQSRLYERAAAGQSLRLSFVGIPNVKSSSYHPSKAPANRKRVANPAALFHIIVELPHARDHPCRRLGPVAPPRECVPHIAGHHEYVPRRGFR